MYMDMVKWIGKNTSEWTEQIPCLHPYLLIREKTSKGTCLYFRTSADDRQ